MGDANTIAIGFKHGILKFSPMVTSDPFYAFNVGIHFILNFSTKHFKLIKSFEFFSKKICLCEPREIIYTNKNVSLST